MLSKICILFINGVIKVESFWRIKNKSQTRVSWLINKDYGSYDSKITHLSEIIRNFYLFSDFQKFGV